MSVVYREGSRTSFQNQYPLKLETLPTPVASLDALVVATRRMQEGTFQHPIRKQELRRDFNNPQNTVVVYREGDNGPFVGVAYAEPISSLFQERDRDERLTAYVSLVLMHDKLRGQQLVWPLFDRLLDQLARKGYEHVEIDARVKFARHMIDRYLATGELHSFDPEHMSEHGPQNSIVLNISGRRKS